MDRFFLYRLSKKTGIDKYKRKKRHINVIEKEAKRLSEFLTRNMGRAKVLNFKTTINCCNRKHDYVAFVQ